MDTNDDLPVVAKSAIESAFCWHIHKQCVENDQVIRDRRSSARRNLERLVFRRVTFGEYLPAYYVDSAVNGE